MRAQKMKAARALVLALVAALYAPNAQALPRPLHRGHASGSGSAAAETISELSPTWGIRQHRSGDLTLFGGRHNDSIPSLGVHRRSVGLLLQASSEESEQLQGCISVAIAPRFFITRASCVRDQETLLFLETVEKNGTVTRHPVPIKTTTLHPDFTVNLAIVEVQDKDAVLRRGIKPMLMNPYAASYYRRDDSLSLVSIDNIFNPSLALNAQSLNKLIRVPLRSCQYNASPTTIHCFAPSDLASRQATFEFGQGMLLHCNQTLVGLPDCEGLCSGSMFYSATYLATYRDWIDEVTVNTSRWIAPLLKTRFMPVPTEQQPTYVSLYAAKGTDPVCAGSLIAPRFVVTTASCATKHSITVARMNHGERAGASSDDDDTIAVANITPHPQFANTTALSNDVAILELRGPTIYFPTLLAAADSLGEDVSDEVMCSGPRRSSIDHSIMCVPPSSPKQEERRVLADDDDLDRVSLEQDGFDTLSLDALETVTPPRSCPKVSIEQWNKDAGDGVFDVPETGSYYLLGLSTGLRDTTVPVTAGSNRTAERMCSLNDTVGDDDNAALVVRLATPETIEFIDTVSVDHTWHDPHMLPFSIFESKFARMKPAANTKDTESFSIAFDGTLKFDEPPKNLDLGFVVGLRFEKLGQNYCGGSLIAPSYVLTAAHCIAGDRAKFVSVGSHESKGAETELISVKSANIITHPLYGRRSMYSYDVAILELDSQAYPKPIVLDNSRELGASTYLTLYGYGANSASSTVLSEVMRSVTLPYFPRDKCKTLFPELDESMFCAGGELARDACTGDSGSPLVRIVNGQPRLVGVVSSGRNGCGTPGVPGVYAFVAEVQGFIDSVVAGNKWVDTGKHMISAMSTGGGAGSGTSRSGLTAASDGTVLRSYEGNETSLPFNVISKPDGAVKHQLSQVEMATDTPRGLQVALLDFLVGDFDYIAGWRPRIDEHWKVAFYSMGDLTPLMKTMATHAAKPLYSRKNRFARPQWTETQDASALSSAAACASGH